MIGDLKFQGGLRPYHSWQNVHQNFDQITQITEDWLAEDWASGSSHSTAAVLGGLYPVYSFIFFLLFGFGEEAIREYLSLGMLLANYCSKPLIFRR